MKKLFLLLFCVNLQAQVINYQVDPNVVTNPERGFYHQLSSMSSSAPTVYVPLQQSVLTNYRTVEGITVINRQFYLNQFLTTTISSSYLTNVQNDFNILRSSGLKAVIRFVYSKDETLAVQQPVKSLILQHIQQLSSVINNNKDVIISLQAGFIGTWGEWYTTGNSSEFGERDIINTTQWNNRKEVLDNLVNNIDSEIPIQVRYVTIKKTIYGTTQLNDTSAFVNSFNSRVGFYNDCFLNEWGDSGTYSGTGQTGNPVGTSDYLFLSNDSKYIPMTGETCKVNQPRTLGSNALNEMNLTNWLTLNIDYNTSVLSSWSATELTEVRKRLGYRFELLNSQIIGNWLNISLNNTGFSNIMKNRKVYLVFKSTTTNIDYPFLLQVNTRKWFKNTTSTIATDLSQYSLPNGTYKLYLNLPENNNIAYSIRFANLNTWTSQGYNDLQQTYIVNNLGVKIFVKDNIINVFNLKNYTLKIYDLSGKLVSENNDVSSLSIGWYIIKVRNYNGITYSQKFYKS